MRVLNLISFFTFFSNRSKKWVWASARKWGVGSCPAQGIWQGSGFAADQTNAMLATSNGGDKSSRKRKLLRLWGTASFAEELPIYSRETRCFFICASRDFSPCTQCYFGISVWGRYHYPRRVLHAVEILDAQGARWLVCRFYATAMFALRGLNIPSAGTHATPASNRAHSGLHAETRGVFAA